MRKLSASGGCFAVSVILGSVGCGDLASIDAETRALESPLAPMGYYSAVDASSAGSLRSTLHTVVDDHTRFPYTSTATDTWNVLEASQQDPAHSGNILDLYGNASFPKQGAGNTLYNREHTWPSGSIASSAAYAGAEAAAARPRPTATTACSAMARSSAWAAPARRAATRAEARPATRP